MSVTIAYNYDWTEDVSDCRHYDVWDRLTNVFDEYDVRDYIDSELGDKYEGRDECDCQHDVLLDVDEILEGDFHALVDAIAEYNGVELDTDDYVRLCIECRDAEGRRYKLVDEDPRQMMMFPGMQPGKFRVLIEEEEEEEEEALGALAANGLAIDRKEVAE